MDLNEHMKNHIKDLARMVKNEVPEDWGFILLTFPFKIEGQMIYVSNANREDVIKAMEEFIAHAKKDYGNDTGKYNESNQ